MSIIGIISEYNPFHLGHLYHLQEAKKRTNATGVVCVMSGHFVQRGEPALVNKWARTEMALAGGADLILELPVLYACRSAYWFARGGIETLYNTGIVTHLAFGVETNEPAVLTKAAHLLVHETPSFKESLKVHLNSGLSYPKARAQALAHELACPSLLWEKPNNILGLTYLQVLQEKQISLEPLYIKRIGSAYGDQELTAGTFPSATAIRNSLKSSTPDSALLKLHRLKDYLPESTYKILTKELLAGQGPIMLDYLSPIILTLLRRCSKEHLKSIIDIREGLENRIYKLCQETGTLTEFLTQLKTKRFTYTRLQRMMIHLLLDYTKTKEKCIYHGPPYLRVLGFTDNGRKLLKEMQKKATLPFITKGAHSQKLCQQNDTFRLFWETEALSTNLYTLLYPSLQQRMGNLDYFISPIYHRS